MYLAVLFENLKTYIKPAEADCYYNLFFQNTILRKSCYKCPYSNKPHLADITLADYWGAIGTDMYNEKGLSLIFINSERGFPIINNLRESITLKDISVEKVKNVYKNHDEKHGYDINKRNAFFETYTAKGLQEAINRFCIVSRKTKYKNIVKNILTKIMFNKDIFNFK